MIATMQLSTAIIFTLLVAPLLVAAKPNSLRSNNIIKSQESIHVERESQLECTLYLAETQRKNDNEEEDWECEDENGNFLELNVNFDSKFKYPDVGVLESGNIVLHANTAFISDQKAIIRGDHKLSKKPIDRRRKLVSSGERSVLVVRVEADDASTSASESEISRKVFGTGEEGSFNLSSGYGDCSFGQLKLKPTDHFQNGVKTVTVDTNIIGEKNVMVKNLVRDKLRAEMNVQHLDTVFDHVMIILPPGTKSKQGHVDWSAYAIMNGHITLFNDEWGLSTSTQIHEIGHNLGLKHSNQAGEYRDLSGMMGHSFQAQARPRMCFNPAKSWQLNWYQDKHTVVHPMETSFWEGELLGFSDYTNPAAPNGASVILKIEGHNREYFVGFNRRSGINAENQEIDAANKVTVHSVKDNLGESELEAKLGIGESFEIPNFGGDEQSVLVHVEFIDLSSTPGTARVSVDYLKCTSDLDCDDGSSCTTNTCNLSTGTCVHAPNDMCAGFMEMILLTDKYPSETSWNIVDNCNNDEVVMSGGNYAEQSKNYATSANVKESKYTLTINDAYGDGICCGQGSGSYHVKFNDKIVAVGGEFGNIKTQTWGSCETPAPTPSPTLSPTAPPSSSPSTCDMSYELSFKAGTSGVNTETALSHWEFAYHDNVSLIEEEASSEVYQSGSSYIETGCLPSNCYRFVIKDTESYLLKVDGVEVAKGEDIEDLEVSLFGTCQPIID